jgi:hypothetical protein
MAWRRPAPTASAASAPPRRRTWRPSWRRTAGARRRPCAVGIESTIVDCTRGAPVLLRPGQLARADIERAAGQRLRTATSWARPTPRPRARWPRTTRRARACA